jgi:hypothetical protein
VRSRIPGLHPKPPVAVAFRAFQNIAVRGNLDDRGVSLAERARKPHEQIVTPMYVGRGTAIDGQSGDSECAALTVAPNVFREQRQRQAAKSVARRSY